MRAATATLAWLLAVLAVFAGVGVLYLLLKSHLFTAGPRVAGALPLEELAGSGGQPVVRMLVAWLPAGVASGIVLVSIARVRAGVAAGASAALAAVLLGVSTIASEAVIHNERFSQHIGTALARPAIWLAVVLIASGALLGAALAHAARPGASTRPGGGASAAA